MNKNITKWLSGIAVVVAMSGALTARAQDAPNPEASAAAAVA
jgi:hypothetical protein